MPCCIAYLRTPIALLLFVFFMTSILHSSIVRTDRFINEAISLEVFSWLIKKISVEDNTIQEKIHEMVRLIEETIVSVRRISANLRPNILDDLGLVTALQWHSVEVEKRFGIKINFVSEFDVVEVPVATATGLFRIYQEALTNAVRHANAHQVSSTLQMADNKIILQIQDDGKGMDIDNDLKKKSFGLLGIKERAFVMGGQYELKSEPGKGTRLLVSIPV